MDPFSSETALRLSMVVTSYAMKIVIHVQKGHAIAQLANWQTNVADNVDAETTNVKNVIVPLPPSVKYSRLRSGSGWKNLFIHFIFLKICDMIFFDLNTINF